MEEKGKDLRTDVHRLTRYGIHLMSISNTIVTVKNGAEWSLAVEVKEKQDTDPILLELNGKVHNHRVEVFSQGRDGVLHY